MTTETIEAAETEVRTPVLTKAEATFMRESAALAREQSEQAGKARLVYGYTLLSVYEAENADGVRLVEIQTGKRRESAWSDWYQSVGLHRADVSTAMDLARWDRRINTGSSKKTVVVGTALARQASAYAKAIGDESKAATLIRKMASPKSGRVNAAKLAEKTAAIKAESGGKTEKSNRVDVGKRVTALLTDVSSRQLTAWAKKDDENVSALHDLLAMIEHTLDKVEG